MWFVSLLVTSDHVPLRLFPDFEEASSDKAAKAH